MSYLLNILYLILQVKRQDFGEMDHKGSDFTDGSVSRLMTSKFVGITGRWKKLRGGG